MVSSKVWQMTSSCSGGEADLRLGHVHLGRADRGQDGFAFRSSASSGQSASLTRHQLGQHYFSIQGVINSPTYDFRAQALHDDDKAFVVLHKIGTLPSPVDPVNQGALLQMVPDPDFSTGHLAKTVIRNLALGGNAAGQCDESNSYNTVPFAAAFCASPHCYVVPLRSRVVQGCLRKDIGTNTSGSTKTFCVQ